MLAMVRPRFGIRTSHRTTVVGQKLTHYPRECLSFDNHPRNRGEVGEALSLYERELELDPGYAEREHYWRELAGVLFDLRRYGEAAYGKNRTLGRGPVRCRAARGCPDALGHV